MQSTATNFTCRLDKNLKIQSNALFSALGVSLDTAINIFLRKAISVGGFPFEVNIAQSPKNEPNCGTIEAMLEAKRIARDPAVKSYSVEEALEELKRGNTGLMLATDRKNN